MDELVKVEGHDGFARTQTHAIINTSRSDYEEFLRKKREEVAQQDKIDKMEEKIESLECKINTIIELLTNQS